MRILIVGLADSIHMARWCSALTGERWDLHVFPVFQESVAARNGKPPAAHPLLTGVTLWDLHHVDRDRPHRDVVVRSPISFLSRGLRKVTGEHTDPSGELARLIRRLQPDVVHAMEFQHAGYLTLDAYRLLSKEEQPPLIVSNYGSDVFLFGQFPEHRQRIRELLEEADVYHCECKRDIAIGRDLGFAAHLAPSIPMGGGWDLNATAIFRTPGPTSRRRTIALKAAEGWAGRAGVALEALRQCGDVLGGYTLELFLADRDFLVRAGRLTAETGLVVRPVGGTIEPVPNQEILALHGRSRVSIGLSISDGISTSLLEAMMMGSFPIQSNTACADEWLEDGVTGLIVPPEDPDLVAAAIRHALKDDALVDAAAEVNLQIAREDLGFNHIRDKMIAMYEQAVGLRHGANAKSAG